MALKRLRRVTFVGWDVAETYKSAAQQSCGPAAASMTPSVRTHRVNQRKEMATKRNQLGAKETRKEGKPEPNVCVVGADGSQMAFGVPCGGGTEVDQAGRVKKRVPKGNRSGPKAKLKPKMMQKLFKKRFKNRSEKEEDNHEYCTCSKA